MTEHSNSLSQVHQILTSLSRGEYAAYIRAPDRFEQRLAPLDECEEELAWRLVALGPDNPMSVDVIRSVGVERALEVLREVAHRPKPIPDGVGGLSPYWEQHVGNAAWLLHRIQLARTGLATHVSLWCAWLLESDGPLPKALRPRPPLADLPPSWWWGFLRIADDVGTRYERLVSTTDVPQPARVSIGSLSMVRLGQECTEKWWPAVPHEARRLILYPSPVLRIEPSSVVPGAPAEALQLPDRLGEIELPVPAWWHGTEPK